MPRGMTIKEYVLRRLNQGETDLKVLARQTRIQFPYLRVGLNHIRRIRNDWQKSPASGDKGHRTSEPDSATG